MATTKELAIKDFEGWCDKVFYKEYAGWFKWNTAIKSLDDKNIKVFVKPQYRKEVKQKALLVTLAIDQRQKINKT
jgi:hypothetical protein